MQFNYFMEKEVGYMGGIVNFFTRYEVHHLGKLVNNNNKYTINLSLHFGMTKNKVHGQIFPNISWEGQREVKSNILRASFCYLVDLVMLNISYIVWDLPSCKAKRIIFPIVR